MQLVGNYQIQLNSIFFQFLVETSNSKNLVELHLYFFSLDKILLSKFENLFLNNSCFIFNNRSHLCKKKININAEKINFELNIYLL